MKQLPRYLDRMTYGLLLACVVVVAFAFSVDRYQPFIALKQLLFHVFVLAGCLVLLIRSTLLAPFPIKRDLLPCLVLLYFFYNTWSFAFSPYSDSVDFTHLSLLILFFFLALSSIGSEKRVFHVLCVIAVILAISAIYALLQSVGLDYSRFLGAWGSRGMGETRVFSFFGNPNLFAAVLLINLPLMLAGALVYPGRPRHLFMVAGFLSAVALLLTDTRAAFLGAAVAMGLFGVLIYPGGGRKRYLGALLMTVILVSGVFWYALKADEGIVRGLGRRQFYWESALKIFRDSPILGSGMGTFETYYPAYRSKSEEFARVEKKHEAVLEHTHNEFLETLSDLGIVGFLLFVGILTSFFYRYYAEWDPRKKYLIAGNCCGVVGVLVQSLFSVSLRYFWVAMFFWLSLALQSALLNQNRRERKMGWGGG